MQIRILSPVKARKPHNSGSLSSVLILDNEFRTAVLITQDICVTCWVCTKPSHLKCVFHTPRERLPISHLRKQVQTGRDVSDHTESGGTCAWSPRGGQDGADAPREVCRRKPSSQKEEGSRMDSRGEHAQIKRDQTHWFRGPA